MIPCVYPLVGLLACSIWLVALFLTPHLRAFRSAWFAIATVGFTIWAGKKPTPPTPPTPPTGGVTIRVADTTVSNVTIGVSCTTNEFGLTFQAQARRQGFVENVKVWGEWNDIGNPDLILSTNFTSTITGKMVNERRDTQIRLRYGNGETTNEVNP